MDATNNLVQSLPAKGKERVIAGALEKYEKSTFNNFWEYLLTLLDMKNHEQKFSGVKGTFVDKMTAVLTTWTENNPDATMKDLLYRFRNHRSIADDIEAALSKSQ